MNQAKFTDLMSADQQEQALAVAAWAIKAWKESDGIQEKGVWHQNKATAHIELE